MVSGGLVPPGSVAKRASRRSRRGIDRAVAGRSSPAAEQGGEAGEVPALVCALRAVEQHTPVARPGRLQDAEEIAETVALAAVRRVVRSAAGEDRGRAVLAPPRHPDADGPPLRIGRKEAG